MQHQNQPQQHCAIKMQPTERQPMAPKMANVCPSGLDYLAQLDQVVVKQLKEMLEIVCGCETENKYRLMNSMGQQFLFASEDSDCCS